jgi:hypothetical protein
MDEVHEDNPDLQGLLEEPALYPNISAELPGALLKGDVDDIQVVTNKLEPDFVELAAAALDNAGINPDEHLQAAWQVQEPSPSPAVVKADKDKIVYKITFDLPDAGLVGTNVVPVNISPPANPINPIHNFATKTVDLLTNTATAN